jgi:hypothetical protein
MLFSGKWIKLEIIMKPGTVAHTYTPSYSGVRDQKDCGSKAAQANSSMRPYLKKTLHKSRAGGVAQGEGPDFKYHKKNK